MTEILSQDDIDRLISCIKYADDEERRGKVLTPVPQKKARIYDFKRPDKFSREQVRAFSMTHETFARLTTTSLSAQLRSMVHVHVASVDQLTYEEFIRSIPTPTTLAIINMDPLKGNAILEIDPAVTFAVIDSLCGGSGEGTKSQHELTDIESSIMEAVVVRLLGNLREAWTAVVDLRPRLGELDTNPQFAQIVPPNEMVALVTLETKMGDVEGMMNLCVPYSTVESIIPNFSAAYRYGKKLDSKKNYTLSGMEDVPVKLTAELFRRNYPIKEILDWGIGAELKPVCRRDVSIGWLRLGGRRVWDFDILRDEKGFSKKINIIGVTEDNPYGTEGGINMKDLNAANPLVADALSNAEITVSVELGTASKTVKEILEMGEGTIVELDKLAGEPVDVKANGVLIAKGDVVVIDENFGVRISEIASSSSDAADGDAYSPSDVE